MQLFPSASTDPPTIQALLVEDDKKLARLTSSYLEDRGVLVTWAAEAQQALAEVLHHPFDIVLLDLNLGDEDGLALCQKIRQHCDVPVIMVTARDEEADRVLGLELGADDYVTKPYSSRELLARIHAQVRRSRGKTGPSRKAISVGKLTIDPGRMQAQYGGQDLSLTSYQVKLLYALGQRSGRALSREQLLDMARGSAEEAFDRSIDANISRIRRKLERDPKHPRLLVTVRGVGYMLTTGE